MRLLVVSDLHYALAQYDWVLSQAPRFDLVVLAGDHLDAGAIADGRSQIVVIRKYLERLQQITKVATCSGNHDLEPGRGADERVAAWVGDLHRLGIPGDGDTLCVDDTLISLCPWWDGPIVRQRIADQLEADSRKPRGRWIWVHHAPPSDSPTSWGGQRSFGDTELRQWIEQYAPDMVFCGHVHQSPFVDAGSWVDKIANTWVFNGGQQFGVPPTRIVVDDDEGVAVWFSAAGVQSVKLSEPLSRPPESLNRLPAWLSDPSEFGVRSCRLAH